MSFKYKVLKKYPQAYSCQFKYGCEVINGDRPFQKLGEGKTRAQAWEDALRIITRLIKS